MFCIPVSKLMNVDTSISSQLVDIRTADFILLIVESLTDSMSTSFD